MAQVLGQALAMQGWPGLVMVCHFLGHVLKTAWQGLRNGVVMSQGLGKALAMPWQCFANALAIPWQWAIDWHCLGTSTSDARPRLAIARNFLGCLEHSLAMALQCLDHVVSIAQQWLNNALAMVRQGLGNLSAMALAMPWQCLSSGL